jgi:hypothetical protein
MVCDGWGVAWGVARRCGDFGDQFHRALWKGARGGVSFRACGGGGGGYLGCMAAPEVAVLGDAAAGGVHVRVNDLGSVPLCGRRFCGDDYRDVGLLHWQVVDGAAMARARNYTGTERRLKSVPLSSWLTISDDPPLFLVNIANKGLMDPASHLES